MAWWYYTAPEHNRTLVLNPRCASTSMRHALQFTPQPPDGLMRRDLAICLRDPIERLRSALASSEEVSRSIENTHHGLEHIITALENGWPLHTHVCRQVDYYNWRILNPGGGTHAAVPRSRGRLQFEPVFVFRFERLAYDWPKLATWCKRKGLELQHHQAAATDKDPLEPHLEHLRELYADDYQLLDAVNTQV